MKFKFECEISEASCRDDVAALLEHIIKGVEEGYYHGGYDCAYADYNWSIEEHEDDEEEEEEMNYHFECKIDADNRKALSENLSYLAEAVLNEHKYDGDYDTEDSSCTWSVDGWEDEDDEEEDD